MLLMLKQLGETNSSFPDIKGLDFIDQTQWFRAGADKLLPTGQMQSPAVL